MDFINILLENSKHPRARLYRSAQRAVTAPETGVTILHQASRHVIQDCARTTVDYLPLMIFGEYADPFVELQGRFTREIIQEFVTSCDTQPANAHLLCVICSKIPGGDVTSPQVTTTTPVDASDPYGDYGAYEDSTPVEHVATADSRVELLCRAFGVES